MNIVPVNFALTGATGIRGGGRTPSNRIATNTAMCWRLRGLCSTPPSQPNRRPSRGRRLRVRPQPGAPGATPRHDGGFTGWGGIAPRAIITA